MTVLWSQILGVFRYRRFNADERLQFTRGLCADDEPEAWLRNVIWVLICGLSWGCRMSDGLRKPAPQAAEVALFAYNSRAAQNLGSKIRANMRSLPIFPSGIWTTSSWRK